MKLSLSSADNGVTRLEAAGQITQKHISPFHDPLAELLGDDAYSRTVLLNMKRVELLDSSGISWLLVCQKRFRENGGRLVLHSLSTAAQNVIRVLNMQMVFKIAKDEEKALEMIQGDGA